MIRKYLPTSQLINLLTKMLDREFSRNFDYNLLIIAILIFCIGLALLYSVSHQREDAPKLGFQAPRWSGNLLLKQVIWMCAGIVAFLIMLTLNYRKLANFIYPLYGLTILLLVLVLIFGRTRLGAHRWLTLGGLNFQPSEFAKIVVILTLARYLGQRRPGVISGMEDFKSLLIPFLIAALPIFLIIKQPDLGTALSLLPVVFCMLYIWGARIKHLFFILIGMTGLSPFLWQLLKSYQKMRLTVFLNPDIDPLGAGYAIIQSKIAIGSGGIFGKGWLKGTQSQLNFLPERHTDFIFSVLAEEWGLIGAMVLIFLYLLLIRRALAITSETSETFGKLIASGIVAMFSFHIVVNIAMSMGLMPVVGLPLPLLSYGGSSLLTTMISLGILESIRIRKPVF